MTVHWIPQIQPKRSFRAFSCFTSSSPFLTCGLLALFRAKTSSLPNDSVRPLFKQIVFFFWYTECIFKMYLFSLYMPQLDASSRFRLLGEILAHIFCKSTAIICQYAWSCSAKKLNFCGIRAMFFSTVLRDHAGWSLTGNRKKGISQISDLKTA